MNDTQQAQGPAHWLLQGGHVIDGTGVSRFRADVRVENGRISEIGAGLELRGATTIDASGKVVAPGFIDVHTHDDQSVLSSPTMLPKISQGVTTVVVGNCGISLAPLVHPQVPSPLTLLGGSDKHVYPTMQAYAEAVEAARPAVNVAALVGHSTLRVATMDDPYRAATPAEQAKMADLMREAMAAGATGFSTGLFYDTNAAADTAEVTLLARIAAEAGGVYTSHIRDEAEDVIASLEEAFTAARDAGLPLVISHHKCAGPLNWGRSVETLARIDAARRDQPIGLDAYPYLAGSTVLRSDLVDDVIEVLVTWSEPYPAMTGRSLADIAHEWNCSQKEACERLQPGGASYFQMREDDVRRVLQYDATMIGSDGLPHDRHPHPRLWGTFPRVLGHYARELSLFPLEEAVHRMTGLSARRFKLLGRGEIAVGNHADLVVFDPDLVIDRATYEQPTLRAGGIERVMVSGTMTYEARGVTGARAGKFLRLGSRS
ncbi:N-acyl-D-amino-acid deacylase family protein [Paraburkholderia kirstenboschensis]|uniref:D-aminoacylase n=1 Tax=Paraburkholderia kirstenboschensis TaxID=1245436 RepID=A0ABZ0EDK6_9BURK|nr:D-aminoacylase [Paraburkholderia kirstenboschensis]WOD14327.1 D-aminoacylase [Paraburkholderia kirstenboschensis]